VVRGQDGKVYTVRYQTVNAMLLNEFLEEHRQVKEEGALIAQQRKASTDYRTAAEANRSSYCDNPESERPTCPQ
jgi:hypothetical protein